MTSGVLIIGPTEQEEIAAAVARARANPLPWSVGKAIAEEGKAELLLGDRKVGVDEVRRKYPPQQLMLGTYRAAISFEEQPMGLMRHLSVSSRAEGKVPGVDVMKVVAEAFGFSHFPPFRMVGHVWLEEFEPGRMAVNVVEVA